MAIRPSGVVLATLAAAVLSGGIAAADSPDDQFMALLSRDGLGGPRDQLIAIAHERCEDGNLPRSGGYNWRFGALPGPYFAAIGQVYTELESQGMTSGQAAQFIRDAIAVYCPEQKGS
jgi:hypothetical protein